jgi:FlaA1/EpsC-like NDP-sugar epimerase
MSEYFSGKSILVTGGTGSIGSCIVRELLKFDVDEVCIFSRDEIKQFMMRKMIDDKRLKFIVGDVREYRSLERAFETHDFDVVYHAAAMKHVVICEENPLEAVKTNIIGTQNVVNLAKKYGVQKLINISTDKAVNPCNVMGATKLIGERIVLNANYTSVRFGNVAGSRGSVIPVLIEEIIRRRRVSITSPDVTRFIMKISDAMKLILNATLYAKGGEIFVLKMKAFKLSDLVDVLINYVAPKFGIHSEEVKVNITGLLPGEKLHETLIDETEVPYLHDSGDFYIIKYKTPVTNIKRENLVLSSNFAEFISKNELAEIVNEYINSSLFLRQ